MSALSIGVPCREEGQDFTLFAGGLLASIRLLPSGLPVEVLFCVNGSKAGFADSLASLVRATGLGAYDVKFITSPEGKLEAMRAISKSRELHGYLAFVDSDVVLEDNVLRLLWELLEANTNCMVSYGQPVPVFPAEPNFVHRLSRVHYSLRERAYDRPYFHGRTFMLREWFLDDPGPLDNIPPELVERLKLHRGPLVDDIAMSLMAVARWGPGAIQEVQAANVYFDPPDDLRGLYAGALRVALEIQRLGLLYPQHERLLKSTLSKTWRKQGLSRFSWRVRLLHALHRAVDGAVHGIARLHVQLVKRGVLQVTTLWVRVPGTKSFARHRRGWLQFSHMAPPAKPQQRL